MARAERWKEELVLLEEEMRRSIVSSWHMSRVWAARSAGRSELEVGGELEEGVVAYAMEQSVMAAERAIFGEDKWANTHESAKVVLAGLVSGELVEIRVEADVEEEEEDQGERGMYEELDEE
jgi:hypothetical protein